MPQVRLAVGTTPDNYDYEVDSLKIGLQYEGSEYVYLDESVEVEVRRVRLVFELSGVFEEASDDALTGMELWFQLLQGASVTFYPTGDTSGPSADVVPVLKHTPTIYSLKSGMKLRKNSLKFAENEWREPSDSHFDDFKTLIANL